MNILELGFGMATQALGASGQKTTARICYLISERHKQLANRQYRPKGWKDLTEREQEVWMAATWDVLKEMQDNG